MVPIESARLVVVDDEPEIRSMVADYLSKSGYAVRRCASGAELDALLASGPADLIVLDVSMPGEDGISIARRLRAASSARIVMLTGHDDVVDRIVGLEVGADDYLTKPFDLRELRARIRAVLRRSEPAEDGRLADAAPQRDHVLPFGKVCFDQENRCLLGRDGDQIRLTATEFDLLAAFAANPNRVLSREQLLDAAAPQDRDPFDRSIDIRITRIRKKIEIDPAKPQVIKTIRSVGYIYVPQRVCP